MSDWRTGVVCWAFFGPRYDPGSSSTWIRRCLIVSYSWIFLSYYFPAYLSYIKPFLCNYNDNLKEGTCFWTPLSCTTLMMSEAVRPLYSMVLSSVPTLSTLKASDHRQFPQPSMQMCSSCRIGRSRTHTHKHTERRHQTSEVRLLVLYLSQSKRHVNNKILCLEVSGRGRATTKFLFTGAEQARCCWKQKWKVAHHKLAGGKQLMWKFVAAACVCLSVMDVEGSAEGTCLNNRQIVWLPTSLVSYPSLRCVAHPCVWLCVNTHSGGKQ